MDRIEELKHLLRDERRVKYGVDYAITHKYGKTHVMCNEVWRKSIEEVAAKLQLVIDDWHIYTY